MTVAPPVAPPTKSTNRFTLRLMPEDRQWWQEEVERVAKAERLTQCSVTMLVHRIAVARLDLTNVAISGYRKPKRTRKKAS